MFKSKYIVLAGWSTIEGGSVSLLGSVYGADELDGAWSRLIDRNCGFWCCYSRLILFFCSEDFGTVSSVEIRLFLDALPELLGV